MTMQPYPRAGVKLSTYRDRKPAIYLLKRLLWSCVQILFWPKMPRRLSPLRIALLRAFGAQIGRNCLVGGARIWVPWNLHMGEFSAIGSGAEIYNLAQVRVGANSVISQRAYLCTATHDYTKSDFPLYSRPITIGASAWIAACAFIAPGIKVGEGAVVGACSVVTKDVPPWTVCAGNPCRIIKHRQLDQTDAPLQRVNSRPEEIEEKTPNWVLRQDPAMNEPRFSIVTITLNDRAGFVQTHASVVAQSCTDFEWLVIDGGSADGTTEYLQQVHHPHCKWTSEPDNGLYDAMNKGLERATGQYIIFMNSGDRFADQEVLARIDALLVRNGQDLHLVFGDAYEEAADGKLLLKRARSVEWIKYGMFTHHQAMFYARHAIATMRYDRSFVVAADYHFTCKLLADGGTALRAGFPISINARAGWSEKKADTGRRENLAIQKTVLRLGRARRAANYAAVLGSALMRTHLRGLYDRIRFCQNIPLNGVR